MQDKHLPNLDAYGLIPRTSVNRQPYFSDSPLAARHSPHSLGVDGPMKLNRTNIQFLCLLLMTALFTTGCGNGFTRPSVAHFFVDGDDLSAVVFRERHEEEIQLTAHGVFKKRPVPQSRKSHVYHWKMEDVPEIKPRARHQVPVPMGWQVNAVIFPPEAPGTVTTYWSFAQAAPADKYRFTHHCVEIDRGTGKWTTGRTRILPVEVRAIFSERGTHALQVQVDHHITAADLVNPITGISVLDDKQRRFLTQTLHEVYLSDVSSVTDDGRFVVFQRWHAGTSTKHWIDLRDFASGEMGVAGTLLSAQSTKSGLIFAMILDQKSPLESWEVVVLDAAGKLLGKVNAGQRYQPMIAWDTAHDRVFTYRMESDITRQERDDRLIRIHWSNYRTGTDGTALLDCPEE